MSPGPEDGTRSLFMEVVDWMLAPLAVVWPLAIAISYAMGMSIADEPFDRELRDRLAAVSEELGRTVAKAGPSIPPLHTLDRIRADSADRAYAQVIDEQGRDLSGDAFVPFPPADACVDDEVRFRNASTEEGELRIACRWVHMANGPRVAVQMAEGVARRQEHAKQVTLMVMGVVLLLVPLTVALVGFGIFHGLAPVRRLRDSIEARSSTDLSALPAQGAPEEIAPLLKTLNTQLERVRGNLEAQRRFVADAAHQLRTPLAALKTQVQVGRAARSPADAAERLAHVAEGVEHVSRLANQLLALARVDDARPGDVTVVDLGALLRVVCQDLADAAIARSIRLALDVPAAGPHVAGDAGLLHELFVNLLDNAIRYSPAGGEIEVRAIAGPVPVAEVEDSGPGIPAAERELVFERFYRVLGTGVPGSGLGLSIVKSIAARHGAAVALHEGREGRGTRVRVTFHPRENP